MWKERGSERRRPPASPEAPGAGSGTEAGIRAGAAGCREDEATPPPIRYPTAPSSSVLDLDAKYSVLLSSAVHAFHHV